MIWILSQFGLADFSLAYIKENICAGTLLVIAAFYLAAVAVVAIIPGPIVYVLDFADVMTTVQAA